MGILNALSFGVGLLTGTQIGLRAAWQRAPRPHPRVLAGILEHPLRLKYRDPAQTLGPFGLAEGMSVLDLGCGTGLFTGEMAGQVGASGVVYAVDIQSALLEQARRRTDDAGLSARVRFHQSGAYRLPLLAESVDIAILIATFSEIPNAMLLLEELRRVLKPGGRIGISEEMPHPGYLPAPVVRKRLAEAGFRYGGQQGNAFCYSLLYFRE
ncbi:MAG: methyltransferase domain-containing protein [Chloroflexi bacterium]|nr:MAG: methyltransferase domain-containing protein [Chloroflexota bacterium]